ncbi:MAG: hypothetical protein EU532_06890 [Promethearchaeota archaeon]|nr:MAG: hypothetical protein EU532_06890 [Candidatus Lokiarchaeota archaeon]
MPKLFFIYSATVNITHYTIKDIPGSSGRLDVISRCILAALFGDSENNFDKDIQVWVFLENYGTFIFDSNLLNFENFPKNEIKLTDYFVDYIKRKNGIIKSKANPFLSVKVSNQDIISVVKELLKLNYGVYLLHEKGDDFFEYLDSIILENKIVFIIGNQIGDIMKLKELKELNIPKLKLGTRIYLASSIIRLIKLSISTFR